MQKAIHLCCFGTCSAVTCLGQPTGRGKCLKATLVDRRAKACKREATNCKDGSGRVEWTLKVATHEFLLRIAYESLPASDKTPRTTTLKFIASRKRSIFTTNGAVNEFQRQHTWGRRWIIFILSSEKYVLIDSKSETARPSNLRAQKDSSNVTQPHVGAQIQRVTSS